MRAILAGPGGNNINLIIAEQVLFSIGFFSLLYSAYTLVMDRELMSDYPSAGGIISRVIRKRRLYRLVLLAGIVIGAVGISDSNPSNSPSTISTGMSLHLASAIIYLVLVALLAFQTLILAKAELRNGGSGYKHSKASFGARYGIYILLVIAQLLVVRESFAVATANDFTAANNEHLWYPLIALPEILAVMLYSIPDLVPMNSELRDRHMRSEVSGLPTTAAQSSERPTSEVP
ncbi:hypothetical protein DXG03_002031 [Asterophora parasitica]|uniref:Uncharacterized protein n=1 Tax=Asterophora parasitica TaxID=117018 RepID=A0A9P7KB91_9AGAR|nr:hypothetical protein DXG03_002031 [Asterophora parasitica]